MQFSNELVQSIWDALAKHAPPNSKIDHIFEDGAALDGWVSEDELLNYLASQDNRIFKLRGFQLFEITKQLKLPIQWIHTRKKRRDDTSFCRQMISTVDAAAVCLLFERLGFQIELQTFCKLIANDLSKTTLITESMAQIIFYNEDRHRLPPITLSCEVNTYAGLKHQKFKTIAAYRIELTSNSKGEAIWLTIKSPKYRKRPEPISTTCTMCGMTYMKGLREDDTTHRSKHKVYLSTTQPKPCKQLTEALISNPSACWVKAESASWKRLAVLDRAIIFKRELGFDFIQWQLNGKNDPRCMGFLFVDKENRIVGACAFRPPGESGRTKWKLDWIWICEGERRKGHLQNHWHIFHEKFGTFEIEEPLSAAMEAFVQKNKIK